MSNPMRTIRIEKVTLNVGTGKDQKKLEKGLALIKHVTGKEAVKTLTEKRIAAWGLRPGLPIGCKLTLRGEEATILLKRLIEAKEHIIPERCFDENGNISFGIHEYIDIPDIEYLPEIGIMGFQVTITLERPGFRIKRRSNLQKKIPVVHKISRNDSVDFMKENFGIKFGDDQ